LSFVGPGVVDYFLPGFLQLRFGQDFLHCGVKCLGRLGEFSLAEQGDEGLGGGFARGRLGLGLVLRGGDKRASRKDRGERANGLSAMAKRYAVDACDRAVALAMRIHGAMGLSRELGLEQMARDVRTLTIPDGTPGILQLIQGRELTGLDPFR